MTMRHFKLAIGAASVATLMALAGSAPANAQAAVMKECGAEYQAAKTAGTVGTQSWTEYLASCRVRKANLTAPAPAAPAPAPAPVVVAPAAPKPPVVATPAPAPVAPKPTARAAGAGQFATPLEAKGRCPADTVVWVNTKSKIYHYEGSADFGKTKKGAYMCQADANAAGDRAAKDEKPKI